MNASVEDQPNEVDTGFERSIPETVSATFVLCVESGTLETQSLWAIESLRRWGGRFANCEVIAVTPRRGLSLQRSTLDRFRELKVRWVSFNGNVNWSFYGPFNKPLALAAAEEMTDSDYIIWIDSDVMIVDEPNSFLLGDGVDFSAHPCSCHHDIGSTGEGDSHDPFWVKSLQLHGINPLQYPMTETQPGEAGPMRMYWQAGAFAYKRKTQLGQLFVQVTEAQMNLGIASQFSGTYFHEQVGLAVAVHQAGLSFEVLPKSHNFAINRIRYDDVVASEVGEAKIIHYFGSAWPDSFDRLVKIVRETRPDVADWLRQKGPLEDERWLVLRGLSRVLRHTRKARERKYTSACKIY